MVLKVVERQLEVLMLYVLLHSSIRKALRCRIIWFREERLLRNRKNDEENWST